MATELKSIPTQWRFKKIPKFQKKPVTKDFSLYKKYIWNKKLLTVIQSFFVKYFMHLEEIVAELWKLYFRGYHEFEILL